MLLVVTINIIISMKQIIRKSVKTTANHFIFDILSVPVSVSIYICILYACVYIYMYIMIKNIVRYNIKIA